MYSEVPCPSRLLHPYIYVPPSSNTITSLTDSIETDGVEIIQCWDPGLLHGSAFIGIASFRSGAAFLWDPGSLEDLQSIGLVDFDHAHPHERRIDKFESKLWDPGLAEGSGSRFKMFITSGSERKSAAYYWLPIVLLTQHKCGGCIGRIIPCHVLACGGSCAQLEAIYGNILNVDRYQTIAIISDSQLFTATWEIQGRQLTERDVVISAYCSSSDYPSAQLGVYLSGTAIVGVQYHNSVRLTAQIQGNDVLIPWDSGNTYVLEVVLHRLLLVLHCNLGYALLYPSQEMPAHWCFLNSEAMQCRGNVMLTWLISSMGEIYDATQEYEWLERYSLMAVHCGDSWLTIPDERSPEGFRAISWNSGLSCVHFSPEAINDSASQLLSNARESNGCKLSPDPKVWSLHHFEASLRCQWFSPLTEHVKEQLEPKVAPGDYCYSCLGLSAVAGQPYVYCPDAAMC
jgi:hypothetical protein